ncbi:uncharacterized protein LOC114541851 [Dendronephthya gigantea]|uniref:uncharacterized protein LOC114541851 n=1 Tax=Dendronephthya gigantea TaxID=151771 RepID=UPI00106C65AA|nr:uncharacterized protein LOC114541851 [Dendronephthya gigantea]
MHAYKEALDAFQSSQLFNKNEKLSRWFSNTWLPEAEKWAQAFRGDDLITAVHTNNGIERQNEAFKYDYLKREKNNTLSAMLTILTQQFLPESYTKYVQLNVRYSDGYSKYNSALPPFLNNRPRDMVNHIIKRWEGAIGPHNITQLENNGEFKVKSSLSTKAYLVIFGNKSTYPSCQCLDWQKHHLPCKHFCAVFQHTQWKWDSLSSLYKNNPLFCLDDLCFPKTGSPNNYELAEEQIHDNNKNEHGLVIDGESQVQPTDKKYLDDAADNNQMQLDKNSKARLTNLPQRRVFKMTQHKKKCREILKQLTSATYLLKDTLSIQNLEESLCKVWDDVKQSLPSDCNGLALETNDKPNPKRKATGSMKEDRPARKKRKIQQLPKGKYGKPKHRYTGRVGQSAEVLRKSYKVNVPVKSFNKSTGNKLPKIDNSSTNDQPKTWIAKLHLTVFDENVLLTPNGWLSDNHIYACQFIMKSQFPHLEGFIDTLLVSCGKVRNQIKRDGIQIHNLNIKHWVMSAFMNGTLTVYDSLYLNFSTTLVQQLKTVYPHLSQSSPPPIVKLVRAQLQRNFNDCGLFAIANCVAVASGIDPVSVRFHQNKMRAHLHNCFRSNAITMFPHDKHPNDHKPAYKIVKFIS